MTGARNRTRPFATFEVWPLMRGARHLSSGSMFEAATNAQRHCGIAWLVLVAALAIHVADEYLTGFLPLYNSVVLSIREAYPLFPMPTFTLPVWLAGLVILIIALASVTPLIFRGHRLLHCLGYAFSILMFLNGLGHIGVSMYLGTFAPGVYSSPLLLLGAVYLLTSTIRAGRALGAGA